MNMGGLTVGTACCTHGHDQPKVREYEGVSARNFIHMTPNEVADGRTASAARTSAACHHTTPPWTTGVVSLTEGSHMLTGAGRRSEPVTFAEQQVQTR